MIDEWCNIKYEIEKRGIGWRLTIESGSKIKTLYYIFGHVEIH